MTTVLFIRPWSITITCERNSQEVWKFRLVLYLTHLSWNWEEGNILPWQINLGRIGINCAAKLQVKTVITWLIDWFFTFIVASSSYSYHKTEIKFYWLFWWATVSHWRCCRTITKLWFEALPWDTIIESQGNWTRCYTYRGRKTQLISKGEGGRASDRGRVERQEPQISHLPL